MTAASVLYVDDDTVERIVGAASKGTYLLERAADTGFI
jgi:hypothetical protein